MIPFKVKLESNGFNIYDADDTSDWLLGNITREEAIQLAAELLREVNAPSLASSASVPSPEQPSTPCQTAPASAQPPSASNHL